VQPRFLIGRGVDKFLFLDLISNLRIFSQLNWDCYSYKSNNKQHILFTCFLTYFLRYIYVLCRLKIKNEYSISVSGNYVSGASLRITYVQPFGHENRVVGRSIVTNYELRTAPLTK
jgi:hypothetical protein